MIFPIKLRSNISDGDTGVGRDSQLSAQLMFLVRVVISSTRPAVVCEASIL